MNFIELIESRFSVRKFSDKKVEEEKINIILKAGQVAPTACNMQPQQIYVIKSEEALDKLKKCKVSHFGETLAILVCVDTKSCWIRDYDDKSSGDIDVAIVTTHMMLVAQSLGIGSTWVMHFIPEAIREEFGLPDNEEPVSLLVMGYPAKDSQPSALHEKKKKIEEMVKII